jgi:hypothetical protein
MDITKDTLKKYCNEDVNVIFQTPEGLVSGILFYQNDKFYAGNACVVDPTYPNAFSKALRDVEIPDSAFITISDDSIKDRGILEQGFTKFGKKSKIKYRQYVTFYGGQMNLEEHRLIA